MFSTDAQTHIQTAFNAIDKVVGEEHRKRCRNCHCGARGAIGCSGVGGATQSDYALVLLGVMKRDIENLIELYSNVKVNLTEKDFTGAESCEGIG